MTALDCAEQTRALPFALFIIGVAMLAYWIKRTYGLTVRQTLSVLIGRFPDGMQLAPGITLVSLIGLIGSGAISGVLIYRCLQP